MIRSKSRRGCSYSIEPLEERVLLAASELLVDANAEQTGSRPLDLTTFRDSVVFSADSVGHGPELWTTGGTEESTALLFEAKPGPDGSHPDLIQVHANTLFFRAQSQLWQSDGTAAGTKSIASFSGAIYTVHSGSIFAGTDYGLTKIDIETGQTQVIDENQIEEVWTTSRGIFYKRRVETDTELLLTHGQPGDSIEIHDGNLGSVTELAANSDIVVFIATDSIHGTELWVTDGTQTGTRLVRDINEGESSSRIRELQVLDADKFVFTADDGTSSGPWVTDGTESGTMRLDPSFVSNIAVFDEKVYFSTSEEIKVSDGTPTSTSVVEEFPAKIIPTSTGLFYFWSGTVYSSDGSASGATLMAENAPVNPYRVAALSNGNLVLQAWDPIHGRELWVADRQQSRLSLLADIGGDRTFGALRLTREPISFGNHLVTDGAIISTEGLLRNEEYGTNPLQYSTGLVAAEVNGVMLKRIPTDFGDRWAFIDESWSAEIADPQPGMTLEGVDSELAYFFGSHELWITDGTSGGTRVIAEFETELDPYANGRVVDGKFFFFTLTDLWVTDGSSAGTKQLSAVLNGSTIGTVNGGVLFHANLDGSPVLWFSDGTEAGTYPLDHGQQELAYTGPLSTVDGYAYFALTPPGLLYRELWRTDGASVERITEVDSGELQNRPKQAGGRLYLTIAQGDDRIVSTLENGEVRPLVNGSIRDAFEVRGQTLLAIDHEGESTLFITDGTAAGTRDLAIPAGSWIETIGPDTFYVYDEPVYGTEFFRLTLDPGIGFVRDDVLRVADNNVLEVPFALAAAPTSEVTVRITSSDPTIAELADETLVFTPANWFEEQTVRLTAIDDAVAGGDRGVTITAVVVTGSSTEYIGLSTTTDIQIVDEGASVSLDDGDVLVKGGSGDDVIDLSDSATGLTVQLNGQLFEFDESDDVSRVVVQTAGGADRVVSSLSLPVSTTLGGGNDTLLGGSGRDFVWGGHGSDLVESGDGNDVIVGGPGNDLIKAGSGRDRATGNSGADTLLGANGNDRLEGGDGNDSLNGGSGSDTVKGDDGADTVLGSLGPDTLAGGSGNDFIIGGKGDDEGYGGSGADIIMGSEGSDLLSGSSGKDFLVGGDGIDDLRGGNGSDILIAGMLVESLGYTLAVRESWHQPGSYDDAVNRVREDSGLARGSIVQEDTYADQLTGSGGLDWFFSTLDDDLLDQLVDEFAE